MKSMSSLVARRVPTSRLACAGTVRDLSPVRSLRFSFTWLPRWATREPKGFEDGDTLVPGLPRKLEHRRKDFEGDQESRAFMRLTQRVYLKRYSLIV